MHETKFTVKPLFQIASKLDPETITGDLRANSVLGIFIIDRNEDKLYSDPETKPFRMRLYDPKTGLCYRPEDTYGTLEHCISRANSMHFSAITEYLETLDDKVLFAQLKNKFHNPASNH